VQSPPECPTERRQPELPQDQIRKNNVSDPAERIIIEAIFGAYVGMTKDRIKRINSAAGGAHVVELWGASHFVFLSNETDVLRELRSARLAPTGHVRLATLSLRLEDCLMLRSISLWVAP
jgi:hypothetical protein